MGCAAPVPPAESQTSTRPSDATLTLAPIVTNPPSATHIPAEKKTCEISRLRFHFKLKTYCR